MQLHIQFKLVEPLVVPMNYQEMLQGFIYNIIEDEEFSRFLHEEGYAPLGKNRKFKLFVFSRLMGQSVIDTKRKTITFRERVSWRVSSCLARFIKEFGQSLLMRESLNFNGVPIHIEELHYKNRIVSQPSCTVRMLSPVTIHSTYESSQGKKTTQYFSPYDPAFAHLIQENVANKYAALYQKPMEGQFKIKPVRVSQRDKVITKFKGFVIEAWNGTYELIGDPEMLTFACTAGLGSRGSYGFGYPEIISEMEEGMK